MRSVLSWLVILAIPASCLTDRLMLEHDVLKNDAEIERKMVKRQSRQSRSADTKVNLDCQEGEDKGITYNGTTNVSSIGNHCINWEVLLTPDHSWTPQVESNYCRNPGGVLSEVWCFVPSNVTTGGVIFEFCDVPECVQWLKVLDFSADNDGKADSNGEYTSATLVVPNVNESFTICSAYMVDVWTTKRESRFFTLTWGGLGTS